MFPIFFLLRPENTVSGIAKTGAYIGVFIQTPVKMTYINLHIRMRLAQTLKTLGSGDNGHEFDLSSAVLLDKVHRGDSGASCSQHGSVTMMVRSSMGLGSLQ